MKHYICTGGCDGESAVSGVCQMEGCKSEGEALTACNCEDGLHAEVDQEKKEVNEEGEESETE